ncbi:MAG: dihydrofolate reductase [Coxiellaceae bacterium]|jgi:dihydrofolate reductase|nr:dihydrofolate reductase [Coxiellaceae bacterium]
MPFSIVAALTHNNVISKNNKLPWDIPEDLEYFYHLVNTKIIVMGHKTYESLNGPLKNSKNIVLSRDYSLKLPQCLVMHSITEVLIQYQNSFEEIMVIGGGLIYKEFLPYVNKMYLTLIEQDVDGDIYFPEWKKNEWLIINKRTAKSNLYSYSFLILERKNNKVFL